MALRTTTRALLLRSVDYRDSDRVVTLLTEDLGKLACIARGAKRSKRRFGGALSSLALLAVDVQPGRGELAILSGAQIERAYLRLLTDLAAMRVAFALLELVRELTPEHHPDPGVFTDACAALAWLDRGAPPGAVRVAFTLRLLGHAGMAPRLDRCGRCGKAPRADQAVELDVLQGHLLCRECGGAPFRIAAALRPRLLRACGEAWESELSAAAEPESLAAAQGMLDAFVHARIGHPRAKKESR